MGALPPGASPPPEPQAGAMLPAPPGGPAPSSQLVPLALTPASATDSKPPPLRSSGYATDVQPSLSGPFVYCGWFFVQGLPQETAILY